MQLLQIDRRVLSQFDFVMLGLALLIPMLGLVVLFSAGYDPERPVQLVSWLAPIPSEAFGRQLVFFGIGIGAMICGAALPTQFFGKLSWVLYGTCILLLVGVAAFGTVVNGSQRWLSIAGMNIQPAEPTKLAIILAMARYLSRNPPKPGGYRFKEIIIPGLIFLIPAGLIIKQPDLGTAMVVMFIGGGMLLFMGIRPRVLLLMTITVLLSLYPAWHSLHDYQRKRIQVLIDSELDPKGSGYHISQSKIAVGSGGVFGKGYMKGTQTQLEFLPEHTTDFVFSVLAEEWGFVGCVVVLSTYLLFLWRVLRSVSRSKELFSGMVVLGIGMLIFAHTFINVGMVIGVLPVVGIPLPMFSHGGSALISCMFSIGIILGLDMRRLLFMSR